MEESAPADIPAIVPGCDAFPGAIFEIAKVDIGAAGREAVMIDKVISLLRNHRAFAYWGQYSY
jgi:hypothetical protein